MKKINRQSGFGVMSLILVMVGILVIGAGAGYWYLDKIGVESKDVNTETKLSDFPSGNKIIKDDNSSKEDNNTQPQPQAELSSGGFLGGLLSGKKNCGDINMSEYLKDPLNYKPEVFACYGQALYDCSPAKITMAKYEYKVEGKSGTNCMVSDSGAYDGIKKANRGPLTCSFPAEAPLAFDKLSATKDASFYKKVWMFVSGAILSEGVNSIPTTSYSATCTLK